METAPYHSKNLIGMEEKEEEQQQELKGNQQDFRICYMLHTTCNNKFVIGKHIWWGGGSKSANRKNIYFLKTSILHLVNIWHSQIYAVN